MSNAASDQVKRYLTDFYGRQLDAWAFYATRNGEPFVDAPHGLARRGDSDRLEYSADTLVHVASIAKLVCAVATLRFIEDWNQIAADIEDDRGPHKFREGKSAPPGDEKLAETVCHWGGPISLDSPIYPFLKPHLKWMQYSILEPSPPEVSGLGIESITIRELLTHCAGLRDKYYDDGLRLLSIRRNGIKREVNADGRYRFDLIRDCAVILAPDIVAKTGSYCNDAFTLVGALIEFSAGEKYTDWVQRKVFPDGRFADIARRPVDMARAAKYYGKFGEAHPGVHHPDYYEFSACGGYYGSPRALCAWLDAVMQKEQFGGRAILNDPAPLEAGFLGCDGFGYGPFSGFAKNGGCSVGIFNPLNEDVPLAPGGTAARIAYIKSNSSDDRIVAFIHTNQSVDGVRRTYEWGTAKDTGDTILDDGLWACREFFYPQSNKPAPSLGIPRQGLLAKHWMIDATGAVSATSLRFDCQIQNGVVSDTGTANRTNLLARPSKAFSVGNIQIVELTGILSPGVGKHKLRLTSDDGALLFVEGVMVIDNDGSHELKSLDSGSITFPARGLPIKILWYNGGGGAGLYFELVPTTPGSGVIPVPETAFSTYRLQPPPPL